MDYGEFIDFMFDYVEFFEEVETKEEEKYKALLSYDIKRIEHALNEHQTTIKMIEQFEKDRMEIQEKVGLEGKTITEIISMLKGDDKLDMQNVHVRLKLAIDNSSYYNKRSMEAAKINMRIAGLNTENINPMVYDTHGVQHELKDANLLDKQA